MFKITLGKGFHMTFANGWTISVQWGTSNYCDNQSFCRDAFDQNPIVGAAGCINAEVMAWNKNNESYSFGYDTVKGYMSTNEVLDFMNLVASF